MTKQLLFDTLEDMTQGDDIFWEHISTAKHPTKTNGEVYKKIKQLSQIAGGPHCLHPHLLILELCTMIEEELTDPKAMALTEKGVHFFNQLHRFLVDSSNNKKTAV